ncbi:MAG TPA: hypothetical protein VNF74_15250 [Terriglobales bacterium]|nr:hypothetical protein [Terriglobales bacterium]
MRWVGKIEILRQFPKDNHYTVNAGGETAVPLQDTDWTEARLKITSVRVRKNGVEIKGHRMASVYNTKLGIPAKQPAWKFEQISPSRHHD